MAEVRILKAVEFDKLASATKKKYGSAQGLRDAGWWVQRKYDGCFGMAVVRPGGQSQMLSRTGEDYSVSCRNILAALGQTSLNQSPSPDPFVVIGEVWDPEDEFKNISGRFRRQSVTDPRLCFMCHDLLPDDLESTQSYAQRFQNLTEYLECREDDDPYLYLADTYNLHRRTPPVEQLARAWVAQGGHDGLILKDPDAPYTIGLAKAGQIVKVKPTLSLDLRVIAVTAGEGKHTGRAGALVVEYRGVQTAVGTGLSDTERDDFWRAANDPRSGAAALGAGVVGRIVEIEAMGLTPDGKLREPRFKGVRHDKEEPDT